MSITDELREWAEEFWEFAYSKFGDKSELTAIADRIDAEHEEAIQQALMGEGGVPATDENMAKLGWIRLPKDADGEYINIGDVMEGVDKYDSLKEVTGEVTTISFDATLDPDDSMSVGIRVWSDDRRSYHTAYLDPRASVYRHYHAPTVEDVLREFTDAILEWSGKSGTVAEVGTWSDVAAEYAKRLTLAEGEDA